MRSLLLAVLASVTKLKGDGIFHIKLDGGSSLTVERACLPQGHDTATTTSCDVAHDMDSYMKALGLAGRNRAVHPYDSFSQCGRFSARPANFVTEHTRRAKACVLIHGHNLSAAPARRPHRSGQVSPAG